MPLLTKKETAALLRVSTRTIDRWASLGIIKPVKIQNTTRYRQEEIERMLVRHNKN